jgi:hypothetical protein
MLYRQEDMSQPGIHDEQGFDPLRRCTAVKGRRIGMQFLCGDSQATTLRKLTRLPNNDATETDKVCMWQDDIVLAVPFVAEYLDIMQSAFEASHQP